MRSYKGLSKISLIINGCRLMMSMRMLMACGESECTTQSVLKRNTCTSAYSDAFRTSIRLSTQSFSTMRPNYHFKRRTNILQCSKITLAAILAVKSWHLRSLTLDKTLKRKGKPSIASIIQSSLSITRQVSRDSKLNYQTTLQERYTR